MLDDEPYRLHLGDALTVLKALPEHSVHTIVTSPPYWGLRDYGKDGQLGLEDTPEAYTENLVRVFREAARVLREDGTLWLNLGDSYAGSRGKYGTNAPNRNVDGLKPKDLVGIPWRVAFALQADGWYLRSDIIWSKPNPMPSSVKDRPTKAHEYVFLLSKNKRYYYDSAAIAEPLANANAQRTTEHYDTRERYGANNGGNGGLDALAARMRNGEATTRNKRSVWTVTTRPCKGAHFATFPPDLITPCVLAGSPAGGTVLDPFNGAGTTGLVALRHGRRYVGIDLNPAYLDLTRERLAPLLAQPRLLLGTANSEA